MAQSGIPTDFNYQDKFDPIEYLHQCYKTPGTPQNYLRNLRLELIHDTFETILPNEISDLRGNEEFKVLDYGSGPVIAHVISAAGKQQVSEIVLAEYTKKNREALHKWQAGTLGFDWLPYINYVVQVQEGKPESKVRNREERLHNLIKIVSCDIKAEQPIENGFEGPYDVVMTFLAIESACKTDAEYAEFIHKISRLTKPKGTLVMFSKLSNKTQLIKYTIGGEKFYYYTVTEGLLQSSLKEAGFTNIQCTRKPDWKSITPLTVEEVAKAMMNPCTDCEFYYACITALKLDL